MLLPLERYVAEHSSAAGLEMAIRNGRRLQRMVNQLLDLQKSEAGKFQYNFSTIDCVALGSNSRITSSQPQLGKVWYLQLV